MLVATNDRISVSPGKNGITDTLEDTRNLKMLVPFLSRESDFTRFQRAGCELDGCESAEVVNSYLQKPNLDFDSFSQLRVSQFFILNR